MHAFFAHILPDEGLRAATLFSGHKVSNHFFETNEQLADFISYHDAAGRTVYHGCASYSSPASRKKENVAWLKCLWLDIDGGPDAVAKKTGYADAACAIRELAVFCRGADLPPPTIVASGTGLHVYWTFDRAMQRDEWLRYAAALKQHAHAHGLCFDPARTTDAASILRTPGTHNYKYANAVVQLAASNGPYQLDRFKSLLNGEEKEISTGWPFGDASHLADRRTPNLGSLSLADYGSGPPRTSENIADRCKQVGELRRTKGLLSEPVWYAALSVLAFADDGDRFAHEWSVGDSRYSEGETDQKLAQARRLSGATTCGRFEELNPALCQGCPYEGKINSPISLSYEAKKIDAGTVQIPAFTVAVANGVHVLPKLTAPFDWEGNTLVARAGKLGGGNNDLLISNHPIYLTSVNKGETRGDTSLTFQQKLPHEEWTNTTVDAQKFFGPHGIGELIKYGANIHDPEQFKRFVRASMDEYNRGHALHTRYDQYGWKQAGFLYGKHLYAPAGREEAAINEELAIRNRWIGAGIGAPNDAATGLARWKQAANSLFAAGCEAQSVALLASAAAPLMRFIGARDEGGTILSLVSKESARGKTHALAGAASFWGLLQGLGLTHRDNQVTKYLTLAALGNLPLVYDEIETKDPQFIRDFIMNYTTGRDKMRADRTGQIRHSASTWQSVMICASNSSLVDVCSLGSDPDAPSFRIFELESNIPDHFRSMMGESFREELYANAGFAADAYLTYLVQNGSHLKPWVQAALAGVRERTKWESKYRFWQRLIAVVAVAGTIARHLELFEVSIDRIVKWMIDVGNERIGMDVVEDEQEQEEEPDRDRPSIDISHPRWPFLELARFVADIKSETMVIQGIWVRNKAMHVLETPRDRINARYETGNKRLTVNQDLMKKYSVERGFPYYAWKMALQKSNVMTKAKKITLTTGTEYAGAQMICHEINLKHHRVSEEASENVVVLRAVTA